MNDGTALPRCARAQSQDDRRVQSAADIADHRHIAAQPALDRLPHQKFQLVDQRGRIVEPALLAGIGKVEVPVFFELDPSVTNPQKMAGRDRFDSLEKRPRRAGAKRVEEQVDSLGVGPRGDQSRCQERLDLRAPEQPAVGLGVIKRADADPVPTQDDRSIVPVPERDGKLAAGLFEETLAQVFVEMSPELGVAPRRQPVASRQQFGLQLGILEDLAVLRDPDRAVLVADRLPSARQVDDRQPPRPQRDPGLAMDLLVVGPAVRDRCRSSPAAGWRKTRADRSSRSPRRCRTWYSPPYNHFCR